MRQTFHPHLILLRRRGLRHVKPAISGLQFGLKWLLRIVCSPHRLTYVFKQLVIQSRIKFSVFGNAGDRAPTDKCVCAPVTYVCVLQIAVITLATNIYQTPSLETVGSVFNHGAEKMRERNAGRRLVKRWRMKGNKRLTVATRNAAFSLTSSLSVVFIQISHLLSSLNSHKLNTPTDPFYVPSFLSLSSFFAFKEFLLPHKLWS